MARPKKKIDPEIVKNLAAIHCTHEEMASILGCDRRTLERRFATIIEQAQNSGKMSLKRKQYEVAMKENVSMLIWLGKQHLGQRDKTEVHQMSDEQLATEVKRRLDGTEESGTFPAVPK